jgi:tetratricopeptide (TPR) repeat protein
MGLFDKLFRRKTAPPPETPLSVPPPSAPSAAPAPAPAQPAVSPAATVEEMRRDPNLIAVFDAYGRELFITRQQWRDSVLLGNLQKHWDEPEALYGLIVGALKDGFRADVIEAARHLHEIDPVPVRGACVWGIVLLEEKRLDEAEQVFRDYLARHGEEGSILTNLAKVHSARGNGALAEETLWHALEVDPNQDNGLVWFAALHRDRGGEAAALAAQRRVAAVPGSWRPQLWLARAGLADRQVDDALALYRESLARAPRPVPADLLMQLSGDLGNQGHLPEILQLAEPHFDAATHGLAVGNNLIKAHFDLGQHEAVRVLLDRLYAFNRPDWKPTLAYWDTELARARVALEPSAAPAELRMTFLTLEGPVWLRPDSPAAELFPAKSDRATRICLLGSTAERATNSQRVERHLSDDSGRLSRAVPHFLAEQLELASEARTRTLVPWIVAPPPGGFVLSGVAWTEADAAGYARQAQPPADYVIVTHLRTQAEPWVLELRLVRTVDAVCLGQLEESFPSATPGDAIRRLAPALLRLVGSETGTALITPPPLYALPAPADFMGYLVRLEQLLAVRCAGMEGADPAQLSGEREILDGNLQLCLAAPESVSTRLLLAQTALALKRARPGVLPEFRDRLERLQRDFPLPEPAHAVVQRLLNDALKP